MRHYLLLFITLVVFLLPFLAQSQNVNPATVDVASLSETQIARLITEMQRRGMSEEQAIALARSRGVSETQILQLRQRIQASQSGVGSNLQGGADFGASVDTDLFGKDNAFYSEKAFFIATREEERLFGYHLFNSDNLTFQPGVNYPVTGSYVVGPGDEFIIDVYGASQQSYVQNVDKNGRINIPNVGPILVGGFPLKEAERRIFDKLAVIYRDMVAATPRTFVSMQIGAIKPITVNVIGEVFAPGTFTLPGTATAFNALYLSGGPNIRGSFREIRVIRNGEVVRTLDVYDYLINGNSAVNISLQDGDVILVPTFRNRVRVDGSFIRTGIFEAAHNETIGKLIEYAGGFNEKAYRQRIELHRNTGRESEVRDVFSEMFDDFIVQNGDSLYAGEILSRFTNRVVLEGGVFRPGTYELTDGLTLNELLTRADGVREDAFLERGMIFRLNDDLTPSNISFNVSDVVSGRQEIFLKREDVVTISLISDMREERTVSIDGEVQRSGSFYFREKMTLGDLVTLAGGLKESASESYVEVTRRLSYEEAAKSGERTGHLFQFTVPRSLALGSKDAAFKLEPYDQIFVRKAPGYVETSKVKIGGEVNYAGQYALVGRNERLSDIIKRAGGLTTEAYAQGSMLTRVVKQDAKTMRLRASLEKSEDGVTFSDMDFEVVGVDLSRALTRPGSRDDIFLQDGDELIVPRRLQTVKIEGEVLNPLSMPYIEGRGLRFYIDQSGGFGVRAKRRKAYVVYPNGTAAATRNYVLFTSYPQVTPGSQIVVPQKPERTPLPATAWIGIGSGLSSLALAIITIVNQF